MKESKRIVDATPEELAKAGLSYVAFSAKDCYLREKSELARLTVLRKRVGK